MHPNIIFITYNYILINAIPNNYKKHFEVKLILNKKDKFKLIHQNLIRICFSNSPIHKEHSFQFTSLH